MLNYRQPSIDQRRGSRGDGQHRAHFVVRASACDFYSPRPSPVARPFLSGLQSPVSAFSSPPFLQILSSCLKFKIQNPKSPLPSPATSHQPLATAATPLIHHPKFNIQNLPGPPTRYALPVTSSRRSRKAQRRMHHAGAAKRVGGPPQRLRHNPPSCKSCSFCKSCLKFIQNPKSPRPSPVARPFLSGLQSPVSAFSSPPFLQILSSCLKFTQNSKSTIQNFLIPPFPLLQSLRQPPVQDSLK